MNNTIERNVQSSTIADLLTSQVNPGFYSAPLTSGSTMALMEKMVDILSEENRIYISNSSLSKRVGQLFWIDSAHVFNPGFVARQSAVHNLNPQRVLRAIHVDQVYTRAQLQQSVRSLPRTQIWLSYQQDSSQHHPLPSLCEGGGRPAYTSWCKGSLIQPMAVHSKKQEQLIGRVRYFPLVVISDLMGLFSSEVSNLHQQAQFQEFLWQVSLLARTSVVIGLMGQENFDSQLSLASFVAHYAQPLDLNLTSLQQRIAVSA